MTPGNVTESIFILYLPAYLDFRSSVRGISQSTMHKDAYYIRMFTRITTDEIPTTLSIITAVAAARRKYNTRTFNSIWKTMRPYLAWLKKNGAVDVDMTQLNEIRLTTPDPSITAADIPTPEEFLAMIECCSTVRDQAILWILYDSCGRKTETISDLNWGDVIFDEQGAKVNLSGKTHKPRYIRLMASVQYLRQWRSIYPGDPTGDAPLFVNLKGPKKHGRVAKNTVTMIMRHLSPKFCEKVGKQYHLFPHLLRHMGITHLLLQGYSMQFVCMRAWGTPYSSQILTYVHLAGTDIDREMMDHMVTGPNAPKPKRKPMATAPCQCPACGLVVSPGISYCPDCGASITGDTNTDGHLIDQLLKNPALIVKVLERYKNDLTQADTTVRR